MSKKILFSCTELMALQFMLPHLKYLKERGNHVELLCSNVGNRVDELRQKLAIDYSIPLHVVSLKRSPFSVRNILGFFEVKKLIMTSQYDTIATNEPVMGAVTRMAAKFANFKGKVIYTTHGFHFFKGRNPVLNFVFRRIEMLLARLCDKIVTINEEDYQAILKFRISNPNLQCALVNGMGVDLSRFKKMSEADRSKAREQNLLEQGNKLIICTGELNANKNQQMVLKGLAPLIKKDSSIKLLLAGRGRLENYLRRLSHRLGIADNVVFLGYRKDIEKVIGMSDVAISASIREGLGLNLIEAMACGLPIVCSQNRAHKDIIKTGACGKMFDLKNVESLSEAIQEILYNTNKSDAAKVNIQASTIYSINAIKTAYYNQIIN